MELPSWFYFVVAIVSLTLWVIQFFATVRTEAHLKKIVELLENEHPMRFGAAQALDQIQRNTAERAPEPTKDLLRSGI